VPGEVITSTLENGWVLYELPAEDLAIALPPEWVQLTLSPELFENSVAIARERIPAIGRMFSSQTLRQFMASGIKFYGLDLSPETIESDFLSTVNVGKEEMSMRVSLDTYIALSIKQLEAIVVPGTTIQHEPVRLGDQDAAVLTYEIKQIGISGAPIVIKITQYVVVDGTIAHIITMCAASASADMYTTTFKQIAQSFRLSR